MAERLRLTRTLGVAGWQTCAAEGNSFVLAALATCLLRPGTALSLSALWQLARFWRAGLAALDADALRLALCVHADVKLAGVNARVCVALPSSETRALHTVRFALRSWRRGARLPDAPVGRAWIVLRLAPGGEQAMTRLGAVLAAAPQGTQLQIDVETQRSSVPDTLRAKFPLRVDALLDAQEGWFPLIRESLIDTTRREIWTSSTSRN
jgi:hypothetical protein